MILDGAQKLARACGYAWFVKAEDPQACIEHAIAEFRGTYPFVSACRAALDDWRDGPQRGYAVRLDIRWPQHQTLRSGPARASAEQAIADGFEAAARYLEQAHA